MTLTREEILAMEPGRELNSLVFKFVIGGIIPNPPYRARWIKYSEDIAAAWDVFVKFNPPSVSMYVDQDDKEWFSCKIGNLRATGKTAPEAICKAALLAVLNL